MTAIGNIAAGSRILAAAVQAVAPQAAVKTTDGAPVISNATTYTADSQLYQPLLAAATYIFEAVIAYEGGTANASDIDIQLQGAGLSFTYTATQWSRAATPAVNIVSNWAANAPVISCGTNGAGVKMTLLVKGSVTTQSAVTCQLAMKQHTSAATNTIIHAGSYLAFWQTS